MRVLIDTSMSNAGPVGKIKPLEELPRCPEHCIRPQSLLEKGVVTEDLRNCRPEQFHHQAVVGAVWPCVMETVQEVDEGPRPILWAVCVMLLQVS
jgi:hypothetical protein